jgi:zinc and cadmium transporter
MSRLGWILLGGVLMSLIALVGGLTTVLSPRTLRRLLMPMVSLAAGTLLGGALFHMLPEGLVHLDPLHGGIWVAGGFTSFLALEQFLHWHHSHADDADGVEPVTVLILLGDGLHNFIGGLGIASTFLLDPTAGMVAWLAGAAHEVPQELGDFGVLVHSGWSRRRALAWNLLSALTFPIGAVLAFALSRSFDVAGLVLFGAGNFLYIAASDLVPEIKARPGPAGAALNFTWFAAGMGFMLALALHFHGR